jgi:phosphohistidine phosphatase
VWVLRHAKAAAHGQDDHSRPLTARGTRQATDVGRHLARVPVSGFPVPELVLSSSARRAVQTAELVVAQLTSPVEIAVEQRLYMADADDVVELIRELGRDASSVLVVGHNPTFHELALLLLEPGDAGRTRLEKGFPTAALAVVAVSTPSWARLSLGTGTLLELRTPDR